MGESSQKATQTPGELSTFLTIFFFLIVVGKILTDQKH